MAPVVTGDVNVDALEDLVRLCVELDRLRRDGDGPDTPAADTTAAWAAVEQAVIGKAVDLLSGPGRARVIPAAAGAGGAAGRAEPAAGYRVRRDGPGGDPQRGAAAGPALPVGRRLHPARRRLPGAPHPHKAHGGKTSVKDCVLLCPFHHQIVIHRWGWTLVVNPDGTTSAWNKNKTKVLHSHGPPARAG